MRAELVFIPSPGIGHLVSTVEIAKLLVDRDDRLSITVLIIPSRFETPSSFIQSLPAASNHRLRYTVLPRLDLEGSQPTLTAFINSQKPLVRDAVAKLAEPTGSGSAKLVGFVVDMFCMAMIDVANEFGVPSYVFYTSGAGFLGLQFHVQFLHDEKNFDVTDLKGSDTELDVPFLAHPYPAKSLPSVMLHKDWIQFVLEHARRFREAKGIMVNTFAELESYALKRLSDGDFPPVYPVGPVLNIKTNGQDPKEGSDDDTKKSEIMGWLDGQPPKSVVYLCFGSMGGFEEDQVREMAHGVERSGHRFLWSLRRAKPRGTMSPPGEFENLEEVLPEGFLNRTAEIGKIIGWAPQIAILGHPAVGGFVSHCGWNSTLESLWFGVPMATLPLYAEQQFNAFLMVVELGLAVEIRKDFRYDTFAGMMEKVTAEEVESGIRCLMDQDNEVRKRVKEMSEKSHVALMDGGSSHAAIGRFMHDVIDNMP